MAGAVATPPPTVADVRRVLADAGVRAASVELEGPTLNVWHNAVEEAHRAGRLAGLAAVAKAEYGQHPGLNAAIQALALPVRDGPIASPAHDEFLRHARGEVYRDLWRLTGLFSSYPRRTIARENLQRLHEELRDWYFAGGGMYLSVEARDAYIAAQEMLRDVLAASPDAPLPAETVATLSTALSRVRTELTIDLGSRRRA